MIRVADDLGREIAMPHPARRIISLVPSLTEALFALGCGDAVVGITRYCTEPAGRLEGIERVGGTKNPHLARIRTLAPELVLVNAEENRREDFDTLQQAGLRLFATFPRRAADVSNLLRRIGTLTGTSARAQALAAASERTLADVACTGPRRALRVFCPIWKNPWMSFNRETYTHDMLAQAGGHNVCGEREERYCRVDLEEIAAAQPEVILLPDEPYVFTPKVVPELAALEATPAWRKRRLHYIDGKALSWYGPRTAEGVRYLRDLLHA